MKHLILALLVATFSLSVMAQTTIKSTKSNASLREQAKTEDATPADKTDPVEGNTFTILKAGKTPSPNRMYCGSCGGGISIYSGNDGCRGWKRACP